jgi:hypothetical protein
MIDYKIRKAHPAKDGLFKKLGIRKLYTKYIAQLPFQVFSQTFFSPSPIITLKVGRNNIVVKKKTRYF